MEIRTTIIDQVFIISLSGKIDFESIRAFRVLCADEWVGKKILFDFENLNFVGSSGITYLVESIETLYEFGSCQIGFYRPRSEFHRIFQAGKLQAIPIFHDKGLAVRTLAVMSKDMKPADFKPLQNPEEVH